MSEIAVLLKQFQNNKKGTKGHLSEDFFLFDGFRISREAVIDSSNLFKIIKRR